MEMFGFDAYSPQQIAERVEAAGVTKARLPLLTLWMLGMLAGAFIGLGALYFTLVVSDASLGFAAIVFGNIAMIHATRSRYRSILETLPRANPALWWVTGAALTALAAAIYVPPVADLFRFAPLPGVPLAVAAAAGVGGVLWYEAYKRMRPRGGA